MATQSSPFHEGEKEIQRRLGVRESIEPWARKVVRPWLPEEHRTFYAQLPFLVVAARDGQDRPWVSLLTGPPGFAHAPDPRTLAIGAKPSEGDALADALHAGADVGLLGIELHTRRRNRLNGRILEEADRGFSLSVGQAFGNCPQYIQEREWQQAPTQPTPTSMKHANLSNSARQWVERSETFFIGSGYRGAGEDPAFGMDASHRGGPAGFVRVLSDTTLEFPDYAGNNHFNTVGNILLDPRVGLLFVDFENGHLLQLTGHASIDFDSRRNEAAGAQRWIRFEIEEAVEHRGVLPLRLVRREQRLALRVVAKRRETQDVTSFVLAACDGRPLPMARPGQYLPIHADIPGKGRVERTYSLSGAPSAETYRISVKREPNGTMSQHLHDEVLDGNVLRTGEPRGLFVLDEKSPRTVALVSAGIGVTPTMSMLHALAQQPGRPVRFVHGARDGRHHPFADEVARLAAASHIDVHRRYSRPRSEDHLGRDYDSEGRVDATLLETLVPLLDCDFYLCGPTAFLADLQSDLERRGVPPERIFSETFGPSGSGGSGVHVLH